jgi:hypothetical protein
MTGAALEAADDAEHGYLFTIVITPEGLYVHHLAALGEFLANNLPWLDHGI